MVYYKKYSPIELPGKAALKIEMNGWEVVKSYQGQGDGPHLIDLSHISKWDLQKRDLSAYKPGGLNIPEQYNHCNLTPEFQVNRLNGTQAQIWKLSDEKSDLTPDPEKDTAYTEITSGLSLLALAGENLQAIWETISTLDIFAPNVSTPRLFQGQVLHIPCQVVFLGQKKGRATVLFGFSRGYGQTMAETVLHNGKPYGLTPGGFDVFTEWLNIGT